MRNYLLLLALACLPFTHGSGFSTPTPEEKKTSQKEESHVWNFSGSGEVVINFIPPTAKPSMKVFFKKNGEIKEVTNKEEISRWITFEKRIYKGNKFIDVTLKKNAPHQILVRINMHALRILQVIGSVHVTINSNSCARDELKIESKQRSKITIHDLNVKTLFISTKDNSHIAFKGISAKDVFLRTSNYSEITGTHLQVSRLLYLGNVEKSTITIKQLEAFQLDANSMEIGTIYLAGKVNSADIYLHNKSTFTAPQLHIKQAELIMRDSAHAHLSIEEVLEQDITDQAQFTNEAQ